MKTYHTIEKYNESDFGKYIFSFDKIDGSNFRAEWDRKLSKRTSFTMGFKKFGTRTQLITKNNPFVEAVGIFENKYAENLDQILHQIITLNKRDVSNHLECKKYVTFQK